MRITDMQPLAHISVYQYRTEERLGAFHGIDYLIENIGGVLCARLILAPNYVNEDIVVNDEERNNFAGHFPVRITSLREGRYGAVRVVLEHAENPSVRPSRLALTPSGKLTSRPAPGGARLEKGYFPNNEQSWDEQAFLAYQKEGQLSPEPALV